MPDYCYKGTDIFVIDKTNFLQLLNYWKADLVNSTLMCDIYS